MPSSMETTMREIRRIPVEEPESMSQLRDPMADSHKLGPGLEEKVPRVASGTAEPPRLPKHAKRDAPSHESRLPGEEASRSGLATPTPFLPSAACATGIEANPSADARAPPLVGQKLYTPLSTASSSPERHRRPGYRRGWEENERERERDVDSDLSAQRVRSGGNRYSPRPSSVPFAIRTVRVHLFSKPGPDPRIRRIAIDSPPVSDPVPPTMLPRVNISPEPQEISKTIQDLEDLTRALAGAVSPIGKRSQTDQSGSSSDLAGPQAGKQRTLIRKHLVLKDRVRLVGAAAVFRRGRTGAQEIGTRRLYSSSAKRVQDRSAPAPSPGEQGIQPSAPPISKRARKMARKKAELARSQSGKQETAPPISKRARKIARKKTELARSQSGKQETVIRKVGKLFGIGTYWSRPSSDLDGLPSGKQGTRQKHLSLGMRLRKNLSVGKLVRKLLAGPMSPVPDHSAAAPPPGARKTPIEKIRSSSSPPRPLSKKQQIRIRKIPVSSSPEQQEVRIRKIRLDAGPFPPGYEPNKDQRFVRAMDQNTRRSSWWTPMLRTLLERLSIGRRRAHGPSPPSVAESRSARRIPPTTATRSMSAQDGREQRPKSDLSDPDRHQALFRFLSTPPTTATPSMSTDDGPELAPKSLVMSRSKMARLRKPTRPLTRRVTTPGPAMMKFPENIMRRLRRTEAGSQEEVSFGSATVTSRGRKTSEVDLGARSGMQMQSLDSRHLKLQPVPQDGQRPVPTLTYGLDRVLFNPSVYYLQDPRSRVYNFDRYLQKLMPLAEFDFDCLGRFVTSSRDQKLRSIALGQGKKYIGSSSSMTGILSQFHYLLSNWRPVNTSTMSRGFPGHLETFSVFSRLPTPIFLRWQDGVYAVDADKEFDCSSVLSLLGRSMEKLLTSSQEEFERYRKISADPLSSAERGVRDTYHYSHLGDFLLRSQLDAYDARLPGTGMFDLKTRAVVSIRMDVENFEQGYDYEIKGLHGEYESYEREYYDMIRSAFLKYSLQVRIGRMDGVFVAFHNVQRIFGFRYISLPEMDSCIHGSWDTSTGDKEFTLSMGLLNTVFNRATDRFPNQTLRVHFEARDTDPASMYVFVEPVTEEEVHQIQTKNQLVIDEHERRMLGLAPRSDADSGTAIVEEADEVSGAAESAFLEDGSDPSPRLKVTEDSAEADGALDVDDDDSRLQPEIMPDRSGETETAPLEEGGNPSPRPEIMVESGVAEVAPPEERGDPSPGPTVMEDSREAESAPEDRDGDPSPRSEIMPDGAAESARDDEDVRLRPELQIVEDSKEAGDRAWLEQVDKAQETLRTSTVPKNILAMTVTIRNKVNGQVVKRPEALRKDDDWALDYAFDVVTSPARAWSSYESLLARRRAKMRRVMADENVSEMIKRLRKLSYDGKGWRKEQDDLDAERDAVFFDQSSPRRS